MGDESAEDVLVGFGLARAYTSIDELCGASADRFDGYHIPRGWGVTRKTSWLDVDRIANRAWQIDDGHFPDIMTPRPEYTIARVVLLEIQSALLSAEQALKANHPGWMDGPAITPIFDHTTVWSELYGRYWFEIGYQRKLLGFTFAVKVEVVPKGFDEGEARSILSWVEKDANATGK